LAVYFACADSLDAGFITADEDAAFVAKEKLGADRVTFLSDLPL
jgi:hypothetical protein